MTYFDENIFQYYRQELSPENSISDFCEAVLSTLKYWYNTHTDAKTWAEDWLCGYSPKKFIEEIGGILENSYFRVNVVEKVFSHWCKANIDDFYCCEKCYMIVESCNECDCGNDDFWKECGIERLTEWMSDIYGDELPPYTTDEMCFDAIVDCFDEYAAAVHPHILCELELCKNAIEDIENSFDNKTELLAACLAGTQIYHLNGNIMEDYGGLANIDSMFICEVRDNALLEYFTQEEIDEFVSS